MTNPNFSGQHYRAAVAATQEEVFTIAEDEFRKAIQSDARNAPAYRDLGWLLYGMFSKCEEALRHLQKAKDLDTSLEYVDMYLGVVLAKLERLPEAETCFQQAIANASDPGLAHAVYGDFLATEGRLLDAEQHFVKALSARPDLLPAVRDYARLLASDGRIDEAEELFLKALSIDPDDAVTKRYYSSFVNGKSGSD